MPEPQQNVLEKDSPLKKSYRNTALALSGLAVLATGLRPEEGSVSENLSLDPPAATLTLSAKEISELGTFQH